MEELKIKTSHLVSIIIPIYNAESYLSETIESVLNQTYSHWELLLVNNCSTDISPDIIDKYVAEDRRIYRFDTKVNTGGPAAPRNVGIGEANGDYLAFLDADDIWAANKLERQIELIEKQKLDLVHCKAKYIDGSGERSDVVEKSLFNLVLTKFFGSSFALLVMNPISISSCIVKNDPGIFFRLDPTFQSIEDWFLWIDLSLSGKKFGVLNEQLLFYRVHNSSISSINGQTQYFKGFCLYGLLLVENKIRLRKFLVLMVFQSIKVLSYRIFGRHSKS
jgi:teichuronic acid biosynthesis glycosyltransferase TuaG